MTYKINSVLGIEVCEWLGVLEEGGGVKEFRSVKGF